MLASVVLRFSHEPLGDAELPPRARRIQISMGSKRSSQGTTSACAENTGCSPGRLCAHRNYLRVRGEYVKSSSSSSLNQELPPRARRILYLAEDKQQEFGTTSACAENTVFRVRNASTTGNYLRVRGEYSAIIFKQRVSPELPPRARRIQMKRFELIVGRGTTSACAENTSTR